MKALDRFRGNEHGILLATDVAARGLDIPGVRTVVHYQLPHSAEVSQNMEAFLGFLVLICDVFWVQITLLTFSR